MIRMLCKVVVTWSWYKPKDKDRSLLCRLSKIPQKSFRHIWLDELHLYPIKCWKYVIDDENVSSVSAMRNLSYYSIYRDTFLQSQFNTYFQKLRFHLVTGTVLYIINRYNTIKKWSNIAINIFKNYVQICIADNINVH